MRKAILIILAFAVFSKFDVLQSAQAEVAQHTYIPYFYNCKDYSRDVRVAIIDQFRGLDVRYRMTVVDCSYFDCSYGRLHKFLWIPKANNNTEQYYIEATTGQEITPDLYSVYGLPS